LYAVAKAIAYGCGDDASADAHAVAEATAEVWARAVASAYVYCEGEGETILHAKASADAEATLETWLTTYADAFAQATLCGVCDSYAHSWVYVQKYVFLDAVAHAEAEVCHPVVPHRTI
jgi:hypothetical protein